MHKMRSSQILVFGGTESGKIYCWLVTYLGSTFEVFSGTSIEGHGGMISDLDLTVINGHPFLISGSMDCTVRVWSLISGMCVRVLWNESGVLFCTMLSDHRMVTGDIHGNVSIWRFPNL